jgi:CRP-like cAMP-binding protein
VNDNGENVTTGFYIANIAVTPHSARTINGKSIFTLQALTQAKIAEIPVKVLNLLRFTNEEYRAFGQNVLEAEISNILSNDIAYRSLNAKDRLIMLRKMYPNIENLVPHNIIASYLGITNVSFSRLRSEFAKH